MVFLQHGRLLHIHQLKPWSLVEVLTQKYDWPLESAGQFASFLIPMLAFDQDERVTARQCLQHDWLKPNGGKPLLRSREPPHKPLMMPPKKLEPEEHQAEPVFESPQVCGLIFADKNAFCKDCVCTYVEPLGKFLLIRGVNFSFFFAPYEPVMFVSSFPPYEDLL